MVAHAPALFDPLVSDWRSRLAELGRAPAAVVEEPARVAMKSRVLRFMLAQHSKSYLRYAPGVELLRAVPFPPGLHPMAACIAQARLPLESLLRGMRPRARGASNVGASETQTADSSITGLIIYGPIPRRSREDFITLLCYHTGCNATHAIAIANLTNKKSASFVRAAPEAAQRLRKHLLPYQIKASLHPAG